MNSDFVLGFLISLFGSILASLLIAYLPAVKLQRPRRSVLRIFVIVSLMIVAVMARVRLPNEGWTVSRPHYLTTSDQADTNRLDVSVALSPGAPSGQRASTYINVDPRKIDPNNLHRLDFKTRNIADTTDFVWAVTRLTDQGPRATLASIDRSDLRIEGYPDSVIEKNGARIQVQAAISLNDMVVQVIDGKKSLLFLGYNGDLYRGVYPDSTILPTDDRTPVTQIVSKVMALADSTQIRALFDGPAEDLGTGWQSISKADDFGETLVLTNGRLRRSILMQLDLDNNAITKCRILDESLAIDRKSNWLEGKCAITDKSGWGLDAESGSVFYYDPKTNGENVKKFSIPGSYLEGITILEIAHFWGLWKYDLCLVSDRSGAIYYRKFPLENGPFSVFDELVGRVKHGQGLARDENGVWMATEDHFRYIRADAFTWRYALIEQYREVFPYLLGVLSALFVLVLIIPRRVAEEELDGGTRRP